MKKLLIALVLFSSSAFACYPANELIAGISIGCPLSSQGMTDGDIIKFTPEFFDIAELRQQNDHATYLSMYKAYPVTNGDIDGTMDEVKSGLETVLQKLESRWGKAAPSGQFTALLNKNGYADIVDKPISVNSVINNSGSKVVDTIQINIVRERISNVNPEPPIYISVIYAFIDQSKNANPSKSVKAE